MIYAEYYFREDGVTAMYGFTGVKYRLGRGETVSFYLDAEKGIVDEIAYSAEGAKVFSSYPSHYFDADVNMMEEYEKIKNNTSDFDTVKEVEFTLSNNNCEPKLYYK